SAAYFFLSRHLTQDVMADVISRMGTPNVRTFYPASLFYLAFASFFWLRAKKLGEKARLLWSFGAAQELACFLCTNLAVVLGYDMQFGHSMRLGLFTAVLLLLSWLMENRPLKERLRPHAAVLIAAAFAWVFLREKSWSETHYRLFGTPRDVEAAAQWMDHNAPKDSLLVCLSGPLNEFLPLRLQVRYPVFNGATGFGSPEPTSRNIQGLARILKTVQADPQRFIDERLYRHWEWDGRKQTATYLTRNMAWDEAQHGSWAYFLFALQASRIREDGLDRKILAAVKEVEPLSPPFFFWLQRGDEVFLKEPPEALGGVPAYQNPSVRLYEFKGNSNDKHHRRPL
ncbi:MAG: hypothetical protein WCI75_18125, partial [candidate division NC10 bacterium]